MFKIIYYILCILIVAWVGIKFGDYDGVYYLERYQGEFGENI